MSSIIRSLDKRSGITYVYQSTSYWDKEKKAPSSKRVLIGKVDPKTGEVVPTEGRVKRRGQRKQPRLQLRNADLFPKPEQTVSIMAPHIFWIRLARSLALRTI